MGEAEPVAGRADDFGLRREAAARVGVVGGCHAVVVAEHGLVHAFRQGEVGDGVVGLAQTVGLGVDGCLLGG